MDYFGGFGLFFMFWAILAGLAYFGRFGLFWPFWTILAVSGYFGLFGLFSSGLVWTGLHFTNKEPIGTVKFTIGMGWMAGWDGIYLGPLLPLEHLRC